jgi:hypothetical protein
LDIKLHELTLLHVPMLIDWLKKYPREACDYSVCNLMTWGKIYHNQFCEYAGRLVFYNPQYAYIFFPVGEWMPPEELEALVKDFRKLNPEASLILIPEKYTLAYPTLCHHFELHDDRAWADYVYATERMVKLSGKKLAKKKNLISQFTRAYPDYKVLQITPSRREVIIQFTQKWKREREVEGIYLNTEFKAIQNTMEMWDSLPVDGIIICLHNRIVAYSIFSPQTADMATIHFEKFDPDKKGSAQVINWETAKYLQDDYAWINREQDIGLEGLRQAKSSYMPDRMVKFISGKLKQP